MSTSSGSVEPCGASLAVVEEAPAAGGNGELGNDSAAGDLVSLDRCTDEIANRLDVTTTGLTGLGGTAAK